MCDISLVYEGGGGGRDLVDTEALKELCVSGIV
jgi:hypothetical protein